MLAFFKVSAFMLLLACNSADSINHTDWKYRDGYHIGDVIKFEGSFSIKNDTIYKEQKPIALFIQNKSRLGDRILVIKDLNYNSYGYYCSK